MQSSQHSYPKTIHTSLSFIELRHDNPHYWLQRDILQIKHFQYRFFNNIILTDDTIPQVKMFTQFLLKFLRFNYQLLWEQKINKLTLTSLKY